MKTKPVLKKMFSRDFTLATIEIWWRAETIDDKIWTKEKQPFLPFIIFESVGNTVNGFYDSRGIDWIKKLLIKQVHKDGNFIESLEQYYSKRLEFKDKYLNFDFFNRDIFKQFFSELERAWVWFEAMWWLWELIPEESSIVFPESLKVLRETTQDLVPKSEAIIRSSLKRLYPGITDYIDVLLMEEIVRGNIPDVKELLARKMGYFFTDNQLFTGLSRKDIEKKFSIKFETLNLDKHFKELKGQSAYRGLVSGKARIVLGLKDMEKVMKGDILVSPMTLPDFLSAMKEAAAIITDEGGLLSHAAITARELKKPCVIGTHIATKVMKDGDLVEVNANNGIVKIIERAS